MSFAKTIECTYLLTIDTLNPPGDWAVLIIIMVVVVVSIAIVALIIVGFICICVCCKKSKTPPSEEVCYIMCTCMSACVSCHP